MTKEWERVGTFGKPPPVVKPHKREASRPSDLASSVRDTDIIDALDRGVAAGRAAGTTIADAGYTNLITAAGYGGSNDPNAQLVAAERKKLLDLARHQPPPPPAPTTPGDHAQQHRLIDVDSADLWRRADVQARLKQLAADTEARERALRHGGDVPHTADKMMDYWRLRFEESVDYILTERPRAADPAQKRRVMVAMRDKLRSQLALAEAKIVASGAPAEQQVAATDAERARILGLWNAEIERAVAGYLLVAENESLMITRDHPPRPAEVLGLPLGLEPERTAASAPEVLQSDSPPVADSVVRFMTAVQAASGTKAQAFNYSGHELANPHFEKTSIGKYSFDVDLPFDHDTDGFYDRAKTIEFFKAVERASQATRIEWLAFYNDAKVSVAVNDALGKGRVGFSGGGNHGQFHHGPAPYILHVHFNIMPLALRDKYLAGKQLAELAKKFEDFLTSINARF